MQFPNARLRAIHAAPEFIADVADAIVILARQPPLTVDA
jgi:hypothetical protein